jgi:hypothetical protein
MATQIIDLDELLSAEKKVRLVKGGPVYTLPADVPVELYLRINNAAKQGLSEAEMVEALYRELLELFQYGDPKITKLPLGVRQIVGVIPAIYGDGGTDDSEKRPTTPKTRGGSGAKARRRPTRSAS